MDLFSKRKAGKGIAINNLRAQTDLFVYVIKQEPQGDLMFLLSLEREKSSLQVSITRLLTAKKIRELVS